MPAPLLSIRLRSLCLLSSLLFSSFIANAQQPSALETGQTVKASFQTSEPVANAPVAKAIEHIYDFDGAKGEYIELRVEQEGNDALLRIIAPDGREIAVLDSHNGAYGPECWRGILQQTGKHQVKVECVSARGSNARYNIALLTKRAAKSDDEQRAKAQQIYIEAWRFGKSGKQREAEQAYYLYENAAELYRRCGDTLGEAQSLESAAALGTPVLTCRLRVELYQMSLFLFRRLRERAGEGTSLHNLGTIYAELHRLKEAITFFEEALEAHRAVGDRRSEAIALNHLALIYCELHQPQEALRYFQKALTACRESGDQNGEAALLQYIGDMYEELGQPREAVRYYRESESLRK